MGSVRCTPPVPHPTNLSVLETKVDHFAHKLDELIYRGIGGCAICSACSLHSGQREATEERLKAQSRLLENLERRIDVMQKSLDGLINVLEKKHPNVYKEGAQAPPTEPTFLPSKTSIATSEGEIPSQLETNRHQDKKHTISNKVELRESAGAEAGQHWILGNRYGVRGHPMAEESHRCTKNFGLKEGSQNQAKIDISSPSLGTVSLPVFTKKAENQLDTNQHQDIKPLCTAPIIKGMGAVQRGCVGTSGGQMHPGGNQKEESLRQSETKLEARVVTVAVGKSMMTQTKTTVTENQASAPSHPALEPQKQLGSAVRLASMENTSSTLVHSCPVPLQRLQALGAKPLFVGSACGLAQGKAFRVLGGDDPTAACGVRFRFDPAADTTQSPIKIYNKIIDDIPPQPAPFLHRFVALKTNSPSDTFIIHTREVLGSFGRHWSRDYHKTNQAPIQSSIPNWFIFLIHASKQRVHSGRFGKVHRCTEISSGLQLAAKIINTRTAKEKERANNEVQAMNQLSHPNILQLYEAFEAKHQLVLILELVQGGELFDRIVDESSPLTEVDAMVFVKQICEGVSYMHQMYVLHLDLKPENILCVNRTGHQVKIIDFGLARRYRPREKLRVNFGTTEFLAPEVVNFDFVSFPTDMWTLGVVTYMLLSGLSPFLGDDENQTLNNVLSGNCSFDHEAFEHISAEAKEFIAHLLVKDKGGRMSAAQCLRHPWLNNIAEKAKDSNIVLKSQVLLKKYLAKRLWKKNYIAVAAANRLKKISSAGELSSLDMDTLPIST
ncbi:hypothetical protein UPYG_G00011930 [Umbra pygmaea]|uniref:Protein kinase domain-containing protein n=1 Tax=Umbra pygmaea TaxID=75934 RepID=A0ABD0Y2X9_UMBPY